MLHILIARAMELVGAASATVYLWEPAQDRLVPAAWRGVGDWQGTIQLRLGEAVAGTAAQTRRTLVVQDYRTSPYVHPRTLEHTTLTASLGEPLLYRDTLIGAITLGNEGDHTFTEADQEVLRHFAAQAAIAIQNARLYESAQRELRQREAAEVTLQHYASQLEALRATTADITRELDPAKLLALVIERAVSLLHGVSGAVYLVDPATRDISPQAWVGHGEWLAAVRLRPGDGLAGAVVERGQGVIENSYRTSIYAVPPFLERTRHTAALGEPLYYRDRVIGAILVDRIAEPFTEQDRDLLRLFADQAAIAIEHARLYTDLRRSYEELHRAQGELVRSEKLRGLGQMAAGIAHDLNNMLAAVLGQAELLRLRTRDPAAREGLQILQTAAADGAEVVRRLQDFAQQRSGGPLQACDLTQLVPEALEITRPRWRDEPRRKGIRIDPIVELVGLPLIIGNPAEIREVLTNLVYNAVDAMPQGGALRIAGRALAMTEDNAAARSSGRPAAAGDGTSAPPPAWVELTVADTGIGIPDDILGRIFDPFFTTKGLHGTGLGLSVVYGILERHGGRIDVASIPGQGTSFRLRFRAAPADAAPGAPQPTPALVPARRILLADDDAPVRHTLAGLLRASGQEVFEAASGAEAIERIRTAGVDLVFTDLGMPEITGWDVARAAKAHRPDLPVVLLTGWGDNVAAEAPSG
ncbi:MAG TPA: GAF domain-containing protein, partial [Gemmatimonadales bacterium]|nr:GAF domain-containing protein [Gemmatimonadales bacterium]